MSWPGRSIRSFGGYESLQLEIRDAAPAGSNPGVVARLAAGSTVGPAVAVDRLAAATRAG